MDKRWTVGSLDVDSLYPSLNIERCAAVVKRRLIESELVFEHLQWKEIVLYLRYNLREEEIQQLEFKEFLPRKRFNRDSTMVATIVHEERQYEEGEDTTSTVDSQ